MSEKNSNFNMLSVPTVGEEFAWDSHIPESEKFAPMDVVWGADLEGRSIGIGVVLMGPVDIPYFEDGSGSGYAFTPLDLTDATEWRQTFRAYIVFDLTKQVYAICSHQKMNLLDIENPLNNYILFDNASAHVRAIAGLLKKCGHRFNE